MENKLRELTERAKQGNFEGNMIDGLCFLIKETSLTYNDLFGEEIKIEKINENEWIIKRDGMPLSALMSLFRFIEKMKKEEEKAYRKLKVKGRRR